jgi:steroid delta-isomerase-like uncharacterized protein
LLSCQTGLSLQDELANDGIGHPVRGEIRGLGRLMSEENKRIVRQAYEEIRSQGQLDLVDQIFAQDYVGHDPTAVPERVVGADGFKQQTVEYRRVFPDLRFTIESIVAEGDEVVVRWTATGTHRDSLTGEPPTGASITVTGFGSWRVQNGKLAEHWGVIDLMGLLRQIGVLEQQGT